MLKNITLKEFILMNIGMVLVSGGIYYFLVPNNLAAGGVSGLAILVSSFFPMVPKGAFMLAINIILFIVAILIIGSSFGFKTIYASIGVSLLVWIFERFYPAYQSLTGDLIIDLLFGILISGAGIGIVFNQNASTGGTDIIAKLLNKFFHMDIGKGLFVADFMITIAAGLRFGAREGMYALLGVMLNSYVVDSVIEGLNICKQVTIISEKSDKIKEFIMGELERGVTVYSAKGAYTNEEKEVIMTVLGTKEFIKLRKYIKELDKRAFITISNVHEVLGEGFKDILE